MTLTIDVYVIDQNGSREFVPMEHPGDSMAGFEVYRTELYGSPIALDLGLTLLPTLNGNNIHAEDTDDLTRLEHEAHVLLANLDKIYPGIDANDNSGPGHRLKNIIKAVQKARDIGGGVIIA
jgi:hypothetical protein